MGIRTEKSPRRSYDQYCAVARGLDVIGDRWTLLIARDLLLGPKRYKDLLSGLPGIGTNLLADRLKELEGAGLIERAVLPPPAGSTVYQLTETGLALEPVMIALGRWGARFLGAPKKSDVMVPRAYFVAMRGVFDREAAAALSEIYEVRIADLVFEVRPHPGASRSRDGPHGDGGGVGRRRARRSRRGHVRLAAPQRRDPQRPDVSAADSGRCRCERSRRDRQG